jgi:predicted DNA-binding antitoxin AbrB/MazE fold protein
MARVVEAIYENGTLKPLETLDLLEYQRVRITIHEPIVESPDETLEAWHHERLPSPFKPLPRKKRPGPQANETYFLRMTTPLTDSYIEYI